MFVCTMFLIFFKGMMYSRDMIFPNPTFCAIQCNGEIYSAQFMLTLFLHNYLFPIDTTVQCVFVFYT